MVMLRYSLKLISNRFVRIPDEGDQYEAGVLSKNEPSFCMHQELVHESLKFLVIPKILKSGGAERDIFAFAVGCQSTSFQSCFPA